MKQTHVSGVKRWRNSKGRRAPGTSASDTESTQIAGKGTLEEEVWKWVRQPAGPGLASPGRLGGGRDAWGEVAFPLSDTARGTDGLSADHVLSSWLFKETARMHLPRL